MNEGARVRIVDRNDPQRVQEGVVLRVWSEDFVRVQSILDVEGHYVVHDNVASSDGIEGADWYVLDVISSTSDEAGAASSVVEGEGVDSP